MEKVRAALTASEAELEMQATVDALDVRPPRRDCSFFEGFSLHGIRVERIGAGFLTCSLTVPPRLTGKEGNLSVGAIANLVDEIGAAAIRARGLHSKVSVDMSICILSAAKLDDELEISSRVLGNKEKYTGTIVVLKNKTTGELVAGGRHSLFGNLLSKV